ncbi:MAG: hypothetical protein AAB288_13990, partial [Acidobacteriota bacterium]
PPFPAASGAEASPPAEIQKKYAPPAAPVLPTLGRGGQVHKYLQHFIKHWGEGLGFKATIEYQIPNGGNIDVLLEKEDRTIACEMNVTSPIEAEVENIEKCLAGKYSFVAMICEDSKRLGKIKKLAGERIKDLERVRFVDKAGFCAFVEEQEAKGATKTEKVRGRKVVTKFEPLTSSEKEDKSNTIAEIIAKSISKRKKE